MLRKFFIYIIVCYKNYISPLTPPSCRFTPSCSSYFIQSLEHYGLLKGMVLSIIRILKCHPFHPGGYDPIIKE